MRYYWKEGRKEGRRKRRGSFLDLKLCKGHTFFFTQEPRVSASQRLTTAGFQLGERTPLASKTLSSSQLLLGIGQEVGILIAALSLQWPCQAEPAGTATGCSQSQALLGCLSSVTRERSF